MSKAAVLVFADTETHGDLGRIANALTTVKEFKEAGDVITLVFDGAGVKWVAELSKSDHRLHGLFASLKDKVGGACSYCASAFGVRQAVEASGVKLLADYQDHPSLRTLVASGHEIITF